MNVSHFFLAEGSVRETDEKEHGADEDAEEDDVGPVVMLLLVVEADPFWFQLLVPMLYLAGGGHQMLINILLFTLFLYLF